VELHNAYDLGRDRARQHLLLVRHLRHAVPRGDAVGVDDRHCDQTLHAGLRARSLKVSRRRHEKVRGFLLIGRWSAGGVDHPFHAYECLGEATARDEVDARRARHRHHLVTALPEHVDGVVADPARASCNRDLHVHLLVTSVGSGRHWYDATRRGM
jgi:hypothetical protein